MSALQAFRSVGPWSLVLTLAMASGARTEPTEIAALPAGEPTTKVADHLTVGRTVNDFAPDVHATISPSVD
jgi:hypothetical protein